jgi:hypothetical protein
LGLWAWGNYWFFLTPLYEPNNDGKHQYQHQQHLNVGDSTLIRRATRP